MGLQGGQPWLLRSANMVSSRTKRAWRGALLDQQAVRGNLSLARELSEQIEIREVRRGQILIEQGADDHDIFCILKGHFEIIIQGRRIAAKGPGEQVGEIAAILSSLRRSATVLATESSVVAKLGASDLIELPKKHKFKWGHSP